MKNIYVIYGGPSTEHEVSLTSAKSLINNLPRDKYKVNAIYVTRDKKFVPILDIKKEIKSEKELIKDTELSVIQSISKTISYMDSDDAVVFPVIHGAYGEDGKLQGLLDSLDVSYVGCSVIASAICMDKGYANDILELHKIPQAKYLVLTREDDYKPCEIFEKISPTVYVKPCNAGSSVGVMKASNSDELDRAIKNAFKFDNRILIEEEIIGDELQIAVMGNDKPVASKPGVYKIHDSLFFDYDAKYNDEKTELLIPYPMDEDLEKKARLLAEKTYTILGCQGLSRVDIFVRDKDLLVNEVNTVPGLTPHSMFPLLWKPTNGMGLSDVFDKLIDLAIDEHERKKDLKIER